MIEGINDLSTWKPELASEWSDKNEKKPNEVTAFANSKAWWHCRKCGNEWKSVINARVKGTVCPVCAEREVLAGYNDLATTDRELLVEWDYELNKLKPTEVSRSKEIIAEALCEIVFEKAADTVCCRYKESIRRNITYERDDWILWTGLRKMRRMHSDRQ